MKSKKRSRNYLDLFPIHSARLRWSQNDKGLVTLDIDNKGVFNRIAQALLNKPKTSHVHLDAFGSFVWLIADGSRSVYDIGKAVDERFGESAHPLYERLTRFLQTLESYRFIKFSA